MVLYIFRLGKIFYCEPEFFVGFCVPHMEHKNYIPAVKQIVGLTNLQE